MGAPGKRGRADGQTDGPDAGATRTEPSLCVPSLGGGSSHAHTTTVESLTHAGSFVTLRCGASMWGYTYFGRGLSLGCLSGRRVSSCADRRSCSLWGGGLAVAWGGGDERATRAGVPGRSVFPFSTFGGGAAPPAALSISRLVVVRVAFTAVRFVRASIVVPLTALQRAAHPRPRKTDTAHRHSRPPPGSLALFWVVCSGAVVPFDLEFDLALGPSCKHTNERSQRIASRC